MSLDLSRVMFWQRQQQGPGSYVLFRSRFQPVTKGHKETIRYFFKELSPSIEREIGTRPTLVLSIVCDLLRGTELRREISQQATAGNEKLAQYLLRFRPEFNPLVPLEVIEDLFFLINKLPRAWRRRTTITLMPEFGCTLYALHNQAFSEDASYMLKSLLPSAKERRWLIPCFDQDDAIDIEIATEKGESLHILRQGSRHLSNHEYSINGQPCVGLYGYATWCILHEQSNALRQLMPKEVYKRWRSYSMIQKARTRAISRLESLNKTVEEASHELSASPGFQCATRRSDHAMASNAEGNDSGFHNIFFGGGSQ